MLDDLSRAGLLASLEAAGLSSLGAGAPLTPLTHLAVHWIRKERRWLVITTTSDNVIAYFSEVEINCCLGSEQWYFNFSILGWPCAVHSMTVSLGSKSSGQTWWHLPLSWYRPGRHRVHVSLFTHTSHSAGHSVKTEALALSTVTEDAYNSSKLVLSISLCMFIIALQDEDKVISVLLVPYKKTCTHCEHTPSVCRCGPAPRGSSPGTCPGGGRILPGIVCRSSCWSRSRTPTCTLTEKHRPTASVYLNHTSYRVCPAC